jgi:hypothetical protein
MRSWANGQPEFSDIHRDQPADPNRIKIGQICKWPPSPELPSSSTQEMP